MAIELAPPCYNELTLEECLPIFQENGVKVVHTAAHHISDLPEHRLSEVGRMYREAGVRIYCVHGLDPDGLASLDEGERRKVVEKHKKFLHKLQLIGADVMVIHGGRVEEEGMVPLARSALVESLRELSEEAKDEGVRIALENDGLSGGKVLKGAEERMKPPWRQFAGHRRFPGSLLPGTKDVREVIEEVGSPWLGACLDTGHANIYGEVGEQVEILGEKIITVHMQDNEGRADQHMQPPYGTVDWEAFGRVLRRVGYEEPILIESGPRGDVPFRRMLEECAALLNDIGLDTGTPFTFKVAGFLTGREIDELRMYCSRCRHYVISDGKECFCMCRRWRTP